MKAKDPAVCEQPMDFSYATTCLQSSKNEAIQKVKEITNLDEALISRTIDACSSPDGKFSLEHIIDILIDENPTFMAQRKGTQDGSSSQSLSPGTKTVPDVNKFDSLDFIDECDIQKRSYDGEPCGLKNLGNTCWFNSVIQALFAVRRFRDILLSFEVPDKVLSLLSHDELKTVSFALELRKFFALMQFSQRRVINPTPLLNKFKEASKLKIEDFAQQDIAEMMGSILDEVSYSFDIIIQKTPSDMPSKMINTKLNEYLRNLLEFEVQVTRKKGDGKSHAVGQEVFCQLNLKVTDCSNIYDGLENFCFGPSNGDESSVQRWIVSLPTVLFICLNRYQFSQASKSHTKINKLFDFYDTLYLDRFVRLNKEIVESKRRTVQSIIKQLKCLKDELKNYETREYNKEFFSLESGILATLSFINNIMPSKSQSRLTTDPFYQRFRSLKANPDKLLTTESCLGQLLDDLRDAEKSLREQIDGLQNTLDSTYKVPALMKYEYKLQSICVHKGSTDIGHFWTFIWNSPLKSWFLLNDSEVVKTDWKDIYESSVGSQYGGDNPEKIPCAYFLIYEKVHLDDVEDFNACTVRDSQHLPDDLSYMLGRENEMLDKELQNYAVQKLYRELRATCKTLDPVRDETSEAGFNVEIVKPLMLQNDSSFLDALNQAANEILEKPLEECVENAVNMVLKNCVCTDEEFKLLLPQKDLRLDNFILYLHINDASHNIKRIAILDIFKSCFWNFTDMRVINLQMKADLMLRQMRSQQSIFDAYNRFLVYYGDFRSTAAVLIKGVQKLFAKEYDKAAPFFCVAAEFNQRITDDFRNPFMGLNREFVLRFRRECLSEWNKALVCVVVNSESKDCKIQLNTLHSLFLPCFCQLLNSTNEDKKFVDKVRSTWFFCLEYPLNAEKLKEINSIIDDSFGHLRAKSHCHSLQVAKTETIDQYTECIESITLNKHEHLDLYPRPYPIISGTSNQ